MWGWVVLTDVIWSSTRVIIFMTSLCSAVSVLSDHYSSKLVKWNFNWISDRIFKLIFISVIFCQHEFCSQNIVEIEVFFCFVQL
jgi:hypothetical protein